VGLSSTAGSTAPGAFPEDGIWGQGKVVGTETRQRLCYFGAAFAVRLDDIRLRYSPRPFAPIARQHTLVETAAIARV
jgi:hypothetical protein